jgi:hypothetical protein
MCHPEGGSRGVAQLYRAKPDGYTIGILNVPGMFILQQQQGAGAYDLAKFSWIGAMGEGERYVIAVGTKSPLKTFADLKALSAKRPVKLSVTGPEGTAYAATMIGSRLLDLKIQLITGYKGSADYVVAAIRGDSDAVIAGDPHNHALCSRRHRTGVGKLRNPFQFPGRAGCHSPGSTGSRQYQRGACHRRVRRAFPPTSRTRCPPRWQRRWPILWSVKWAKDNDLIMRSRTPQGTAQLVAEQRVFFDKWKKYLIAS